MPDDSSSEQPAAPEPESTTVDTSTIIAALEAEAEQLGAIVAGLRNTLPEATPPTDYLLSEARKKTSSRWE